MRLKQSPFNDFNSRKKTWKDVTMFFILTISVTTTSYSFHTIIFIILRRFYYFCSYYYLSFSILIGRGYESLDDDHPKPLKKRYAYIGLFASVFAFSVRFLTLEFIADPEILDDDFMYIGHCNFIFLIEIYLWLLISNLNLTRKEYLKLPIPSKNDDVVLGVGFESSSDSGTSSAQSHYTSSAYIVNVDSKK